ncbi:beta-N-acetylhexosaminidase [Hoeflea sp. CAU 1731]
MSESKAMILGCGGLALTDDERAFFAKERPWGFILFARNIDDADQVRALVSDLRECVDRSDAPVLVDQEGGRVQRLRPPLAPRYPAASVLGYLYAVNKDKGLRAAWLLSRLHAVDLAKLGISVDCLPVLDVPVAGSHDVIGNRAYGHDPHLVSAMGAAAMEGLIAGGVLPVIKHMPGHGRANVDSHHDLPQVDAPLSDLEASDFIPFMALAASAPMAMTAHVVYTGIDADGPATTSRKVIEDVVRTKLGFDGILMSDDISMKALSGDFASKTSAIFQAGCDVILHCNGSMDEMPDVADNTPMLQGKPLQRADRVMSMFKAPQAADEAALRAEFDDLLSTNNVMV